MLCLPYLALAAWLAATGKLGSVVPFAASVLLIEGLLAIIARTWRRFFWLNAPFWLLTLVFAGYTLTYGDVPGELLAYVLATSSWEEVRGFFGIWQGERLLLESDSCRSLAANVCIFAQRPGAAFRAPRRHRGALRSRRLEPRSPQGGPHGESADW
jgi:hypothetical protein